MARSLNSVTLVGNLGADPEIRTVNGGSQIATMSVATSTSWKDDKGQWQEKTQWHRVVAWQNAKGPALADLAAKLSKGDKVCVQGMIEYRTWEDNTGQKRYMTEIKAQTLIPLSPTKPAGSTPQAPPRTREDFADFPDALTGQDDDLPF